MRLISYRRIFYTLLKEDAKMKILVIEPMKEPYVKEIERGLESMQEVVGGLIQAIYPFDHPEIALICNEEGKLNKLRLNRALFDKDRNIVDIVAGTFFLCSAPADSENVESVSDEQIEKYKKRFEALEFYFKY